MFPIYLQTQYIFFNTEMIEIYIILGLRLPDSKVLMRGHLATKIRGDISHYAQENNGDGNITIMLLKHKPNLNMMQFGLLLDIVVILKLPYSQQYLDQISKHAWQDICIPSK